MGESLSILYNVQQRDVIHMNLCNSKALEGWCWKSRINFSNILLKHVTNDYTEGFKYLTISFVNYTTQYTTERLNLNWKKKKKDDYHFRWQRSGSYEFGQKFSRISQFLCVTVMILDWQWVCCWIREFKESSRFEKVL